MIKAGHNIMLSRYYVKSAGVQDAGESLQPDPYSSGIPHTYKAGGRLPGVTLTHDLRACSLVTVSPWPAGLGAGDQVTR